MDISCPGSATPGTGFSERNRQEDIWPQNLLKKLKKAEAEADAIIKESQAQAGETVKAAEAEREMRLAQAVLQARRAAEDLLAAAAAKADADAAARLAENGKACAAMQGKSSGEKIQSYCLYAKIS